MIPLPPSSEKLLQQVCDQSLSGTATVETLIQFARRMFMYLKVIGSYVRHTVDPTYPARDVDLHAEPRYATSCEELVNFVEREFVVPHKIQKSFSWIPRELPLIVYKFPPSPSKTGRPYDTELKISPRRNAVLTACDHLVIAFPEEGSPLYATLTTELSVTQLQHHIREREDWLIAPETLQSFHWERLAGRLNLGNRFIHPVSMDGLEHLCRLDPPSFDTIINRRTSHSSTWKILLYFNMLFLFDTLEIINYSLATEFPLQSFLRDAKNDPFLLCLIQFMTDPFPASLEERYSALSICVDYLMQRVMKISPRPNFGSPSLSIQVPHHGFLHFKSGPFPESAQGDVKAIPTTTLNRLFRALVEIVGISNYVPLGVPSTFLDGRMMPLFLHRINFSSLDRTIFFRLLRSALENADTDADLALVPNNPHWSPDLLLPALYFFIQRGPTFTETIASLLSRLLNGDAKVRLNDKMVLISVILKQYNHIPSYRKPILDFLQKMPPNDRNRYISRLSAELLHILYRMAKELSHPMKNKLEETLMQFSKSSLQDFPLPIALSIKMRQNSQECLSLLKARTKNPEDFLSLLEHPSSRFQILSLLDELFQKDMALQEWLLDTFRRAHEKLFLLGKLLYRYYFFPQTRLSTPFRDVVPLSPAFFGKSLIDFFRESNVETQSEILTITLQACTDKTFCEELCACFQSKAPYKYLQFLQSLFQDRLPITEAGKHCIEKQLETLPELFISSLPEHDFAALYLAYFLQSNALEHFTEIFARDSEFRILHSPSWVILFNSLFQKSSEEFRAVLKEYSGHSFEIVAASLPLPQIISYLTAHEEPHSHRIAIYVLKQRKPSEQLQLVLSLHETNPSLALNILCEMRRTSPKTFIMVVEGCWKKLSSLEPDFRETVCLFPLTEEEKRVSPFLAAREFEYFRQDLSHFRELFHEEIPTLFEKRFEEVLKGDMASLKIGRLELELLSFYFEMPEMHTKLFRNIVKTLLKHISDDPVLHKLRPYLSAFAASMQPEDIIAFGAVMIKLHIPFQTLALQLKLLYPKLHTAEGTEFVVQLHKNADAMLSLDESEKALTIFLFVLFANEPFASEKAMSHYISQLHGKSSRQTFDTFTEALRLLLAEYALLFWEAPPIEEHNIPIASFKINLITLIKLMQPKDLASRFYFELFQRTVYMCDGYKTPIHDYKPFVQEFIRVVIDIEAIHRHCAGLLSISESHFEILIRPAMEFYMKILQRIPKEEPDPIDRFFEGHPDWIEYPHSKLISLLDTEMKETSVADFMNTCRKMQLPSVDVLEPELAKFYLSFCLGFPSGNLRAWHEYALCLAYVPEAGSWRPMDALQLAIVSTNFAHLRTLSDRGRELLLDRLTTGIKDPEGKMGISQIISRFSGSLTVKDRADFAQALIDCNIPLLPDTMTAKSLIQFLSPEGEILADLLYIQHMHFQTRYDQPELRALSSIIIACFSKAVTFCSDTELEKMLSLNDDEWQQSIPIVLSHLNTFIECLCQKMSVATNPESFHYHTFSRVREKLVEFAHTIWATQKKPGLLTPKDNFFVIALNAILKGTTLAHPIRLDIYKTVVNNFHIFIKEFRFSYKQYMDLGPLKAQSENETAFFHYFALVASGFCQTMDYCLENLPGENIDFFHQRLKTAVQEGSTRSVIQTMNTYDDDETASALIRKYAEERHVNLLPPTISDPHETLLIARHNEKYAAGLATFELGPLEKQLMEINIPYFSFLTLEAKQILLAWSNAALMPQHGYSFVISAWAAHSSKLPLEDLTLCLHVLVVCGINCMTSAEIPFHNKLVPWDSPRRIAFSRFLPKYQPIIFRFCASPEERALLILLITVTSPQIVMPNIDQLSQYLAHFTTLDPTFSFEGLSGALLQNLDTFFDSFCNHIPLPDSESFPYYLNVQHKIKIWIEYFLKTPRLLQPHKQYRFSLVAMQHCMHAIEFAANRSSTFQQVYAACHPVLKELIRDCLQSHLTVEAQQNLAKPFGRAAMRTFTFFRKVFDYLRAKDPSIVPTDLDSRLPDYIQNPDPSDFSIFTRKN